MGPKIPYLDIFGLEFDKKNCHIVNQYPRICLIGKFQEITKTPKFLTKNASCWYF